MGNKIVRKKKSKVDLAKKEKKQKKKEKGQQHDRYQVAKASVTDKPKKQDYATEDVAEKPENPAQNTPEKVNEATDNHPKDVVEREPKCEIGGNEAIDKTIANDVADNIISDDDIGNKISDNDVKVNITSDNDADSDDNEAGDSESDDTKKDIDEKTEPPDNKVLLIPTEHDNYASSFCEKIIKEALEHIRTCITAYSNKKQCDTPETINEEVNESETEEKPPDDDRYPSLIAS